MRVELLVVSDCPHQLPAENLLRTALVDVGLPADFSVVIVTEDRPKPEFAGSPTFRVDGSDLFSGSGRAVGLSCRIYTGEAGRGGLPDLRALRQALKRAADPAGAR